MAAARSRRHRQYCQRTRDHDRLPTSSPIMSPSRAYLGLTRSLALDWGKHNIRAIAVSPGWVRTQPAIDFLEAAEDPAAEEQRVKDLHPAEAHRRAKRHRRTGRFSGERRGQLYHRHGNRHRRRHHQRATPIELERGREGETSLAPTDVDAGRITRRSYENRAHRRLSSRSSAA